MRALNVPESNRTSNIRTRYIERGKQIQMRWAVFLESYYQGTFVPGPATLTDKNEKKSVKRGSSKPIILVDTGTKTEFSSITDLVVHLGMSPPSISVVKRYMNPFTKDDMSSI